ncbi:glycosyltransferase [Microbacterium dauci]|uniref:Glycosyltransferase n=1 Tax=Microbacterium dauci TaxID=3048008 RepID=A0ABT6ZE99_9MICO|nr:glycosyltransferase [Microbacterium sp. LX3-4]MDJ1114492.1 glycosyltransferase [Microbacterium sp. LX3-4]
MTTDDFGVACVIPTHGRPAFLREALASVLSQTLLPREVVVVADDDEPAAAAVVAEAAASASVPVTYLARTTSPLGASASRNAGAAATSAPWIAFLDDDDRWEPGYLLAVSQAAGVDDVAAVVTPFSRFTDEGRIGGTHPTTGMSARDAFRRSAGVTGSTMVLRRSTFDALDGYDADLPVMNDADIFIRLLQAGERYAVLDQEWVGVRKHGAGQLTDNSPRRIAGGWAFLRKHAPNFTWADARPRRFWQHRMQFRARDASPAARLRAAFGMLLNWSKTPTPPSGAGVEAPSPRIRSRADLTEFMAADAAAQGATGVRGRRKATMRYLRALRKAEYWSRPGAPLHAKVMRAAANARLRRLAVLTGISIPPGTFGKGLCLPHYGSIVVNTKVRFGEYCCIQNNVNIGLGPGGVPRGGDFVYIAPGAVVYGGITVGSHAVIGANSVAGRDIPSGTTWAGAPARQISANGSRGVMPAAVVRIMAALETR